MIFQPAIFLILCLALNASATPIYAKSSLANRNMEVDVDVASDNMSAKNGTGPMNNDTQVVDTPNKIMPGANATQPEDVVLDSTVAAKETDVAASNSAAQNCPAPTTVTVVSFAPAATAIATATENATATATEIATETATATENATETETATATATDAAAAANSTVGDNHLDQNDEGANQDVNKQDANNQADNALDCIMGEDQGQGDPKNPPGNGKVLSAAPGLGRKKLQFGPGLGRLCGALPPGRSKAQAMKKLPPQVPPQKQHTSTLQQATATPI